MDGTERVISPRLKIYFLVAVFGAILVALIGFYYTEKDLPPYPGKIVAENGDLLSGQAEIMAGQQVWQKYGLMDLGSVWGHGTYRGPDFTAQALHLMVLSMREQMAKERQVDAYQELGVEGRGGIDAVVVSQIKTNRYEAATDTLTLSPLQAGALMANRDFYDRLFSEGDPRGPIRAGTIKNQEERRRLADFFFWTAWAAGTLRPGDTHTYTNNWPHDPEAGNHVSGMALVWSAVSLVAFGVCLGVIVYLFHRYEFNLGHTVYKPQVAAALMAGEISVSQRKTAKFFLVVAALFVLQVLMGGLMAHYTVSPGGFYGLSWVAALIPYNWVKTWHLQLAVFWIATAWIGMTLFIGPRVGGREPAGQGLLVDLLFGALVVVVAGSLTGEVLGLKGYFQEAWFWLGHQGWEYLELGRLWQILLLVGLLLWLFLVARSLKSHFAAGREKWDLPHFLAYSAVAVVGFFCFGLFYDQHSHLTIADFWRWWVVHTWVEGAFEFFAAAAIIFVLINLGLVGLRAGLRTVYFTVALALMAGIVGVGHHYYWYGEPSFWLALGSTFSALEPVPILLLLADVWHGQKALLTAGSTYPYRYPLMFLVAAVSWEFLGAGVMGLSITTPVVNYFEHATYLTVNHGHTALFGTYGMLAIGLLLFSMRGLVRPEGWNDGWLKVSFWSLNVGLVVMFVNTLLPVGVLQVLDNIENGFWHARANDFWHQGTIQFLGNTRLVPDTLIVIGAIALLVFMVKAITKLRPATIGGSQDF